MSTAWVEFIRASKHEFKKVVMHHHYKVGQPSELTNYSSHQVYRFLRRNFGKTDYPSWTDARRTNWELYFDPDKTQWGYLLKTPNCYLLIEDRRRSYCVLLVYPRNYEKIATISEFVSGSYLSELTAEIKEDVNTFLAALKEYVKNDVDKESRRSAPGRIIVNPFHIHYGYAEKHRKTIVQVMRKHQIKEPIFREAARIEIAPLVHSAFLLYVASFEGFVNVIYELYARSEIRNDNRIRDKVANEKLEGKLRMLPVYCSCFSRIDFGRKAYSDLTEIMRLRNTLIHADLTGLNHIEMLEEDSFVFYAEGVKDDEKKPSVVNREEALVYPVQYLNMTKAIVDAMIKEVFTKMRVAERKQLKSVLHHFEIGYIIRNEKTALVQDRLY